MLLYLIPPSEAKQPWWQELDSSCLFWYTPPFDIAIHASQKDLKCKDKRYEQWIQLNKTIHTSPTMPAIQRYTWIMYKALWYQELDAHTQTYIQNHVLIFSWMYWLLHPNDLIANYKLPIRTKWLYQYRKSQLLTQTLITYAKTHKVHIIDLLPLSYKKMVDRSTLDQANIPYTQVNFYKQTDVGLQKYTHGVKSVKWHRLRQHGLSQTKKISELWNLQTKNEIAIII